jgi:hypothetical protein
MTQEQDHLSISLIGEAFSRQFGFISTFSSLPEF